MANGGWAYLKKELETTFFKPKTWAFWRALVLACCFCCMLGHLLELPYCMFTDAVFDCVEDDYAVLVDPWYVPYFVYGWGAGAMTLVLEPLKEHILRRRKTLWGALLEMFVITVIIAAVLETAFGFLVNQPDANGVYPYWDNSKMFLNILGQGWLVNDVFIGLAAMLYIWVIFPFFALLLHQIGNKRANILFAVCMVAFAACCIATVVTLYL